MRVIMLLLGSGLIYAALAAGTVTAQAATRTICNVRLGTCTTGIVTRKPVAGMRCRMFNFASSKYRGNYLCS